MTTFTMIELIVLLAVMIWLLFLLFRNGITYKVRVAFISDPALYPDAYRRLPGYSEMCDHPKHYLRWTKNQWIAYVEAA